MITPVFLIDFVGREKPQGAGFAQYNIVFGTFKMKKHR